MTIDNEKLQPYILSFTNLIAECLSVKVIIVQARWVLTSGVLV